jgi:cytochrome c-type biogenesis protein CcmH/NrfG
MPQHAIVALEESVKLEPETAEAWASLGEAYSRADYPGKAVDALRLSVCLDPSGSHGYCRLAKELLNQGSYTEAIDIIRQGLDRCEGQQWLVYYLGKAFLGQGRPDLARAQAERLCRENSRLGGQLARIINSGNDS